VLLVTKVTCDFQVMAVFLHTKLFLKLFMYNCVTSTFEVGRKVIPESYEALKSCSNHIKQHTILT
jgi:hypothetical protein